MPSKSKKNHATSNKTTMHEKFVSKRPSTHPASSGSVTTLSNCSNMNANKKQDVKVTPGVSNVRPILPVYKSTSSKNIVSVGTIQKDPRKPQHKSYATKSIASTSKATEDTQKHKKHSANQKSVPKSSAANDAVIETKLSAASVALRKPQHTTKDENHKTNAEMHRSSEELENYVAYLLKRFAVKDDKWTIAKKLASIQRMSIEENKLKELSKLLKTIQKNIIEKNARSSDTAILPN